MGGGFPLNVFTIFLIVVVNVRTGAVSDLEMPNWMEQWLQYLIISAHEGVCVTVSALKCMCFHEWK